jgi:predicted ABC-type ATPase
MANESDELPQEVRDSVFEEKILTDPNFTNATSQERPKAIVLGGQPGSGKGSLAERARIELDGDVVTIDPDALREQDPRLARLRSEYPYEWSSKTHSFASESADRLLEAVSEQKKNLVFDATLSNGQWASENLIPNLQAKGYDVEIRVVASPKLESELGVDKRFTEKLDMEGHARYVPEGARDAIYEKLPKSLDTIHANSDVAIRVFSREGDELYDSRTDPRPPGQALEEARFARLKDPAITQGLREGWDEQVKWHRDLPDHVHDLPNMDADTHGRLLEQHAKLKVQEGVLARAEGLATIDELVRDGAPPARAPIPGFELPPLARAGATAGLAGLGAAAVAYDAKETGERVGTALAQDNASAVRSEATHFTVRGVGGAAAVFTPIAAGVSGGPAVVLAAADAYLLTEAFDRGAKWFDKERIVHQADRADVNWEFTGRQWIREDLKADLRDDGIDQARGQKFSALPDKARELSYLASVEAVGQAIGKADPRNPFELPANTNDAPNNQPSPWRLDAQSGDWKRTRYQEIDPTDPRLPDRQVPETATPERAAELNRQASQIIDENIARGPAALAAQYEIGYKRNGFDEFGEVPMSVQTALNPNTLEASDGKQYVRDAQGQWSHEGAPAGPNHALELETTRERLLPALERHRAQLAAMPEWQPLTPEQQDRANLRQLYADYSVNPSAERFEAAYHAVKETREAQGINAAATSLALEPRPAGGYDIDTPIQHLQIEGDGVVRVAATTTATDIQRVETTLKREPREIEAPSAQQRDAQAQMQREANRAGLSQDETQAAVRISAPPASPADARGGKTDDMDTAPQQDRKADRPGVTQLDNSAHQNHGMFAALLRTVNERDRELGREPDEISLQLAGGLVEKARERGLETILAAKFTPDGTRLGMSDTANLSAEWARTAVGDVRELAGQKLSQSSENVAAINRQQAQHQTVQSAMQAQFVDGPDGPAVKGVRVA